jgi:Protein of unknown function (DUF4239)
VTDWLLGLRVLWLTLLVVGTTAVVTLLVYAFTRLVSRRRSAFGLRGISPGMLPPMGLLFALLVGFLAAQVWDDTNRAQTAVSQEASALRSVVLVSSAFPRPAQLRLRRLVRTEIEREANDEWPAMARRNATLAAAPAPLTEALEQSFALTPRTDGQRVAQRALVDGVQQALDTRRQRIILSQASINWVKWTGVISLAVLTLFAIAFVHGDNRVGALTAMGLFSAAVAVCVILLATQDRPFAGQLRVQPAPLLQVLPSG